MVLLLLWWWFACAVSFGIILLSSSLNLDFTIPITRSLRLIECVILVVSYSNTGPCGIWTYDPRHTRYFLIHQTDRQTNKQTDRHSISLSILGVTTHYLLWSFKLWACFSAMGSPFLAVTWLMAQVFSPYPSLCLYWGVTTHYLLSPERQTDRQINQKHIMGSWINSWVEYLWYSWVVVVVLANDKTGRWWSGVTCGWAAKIYSAMESPLPAVSWLKVQITRGPGFFYISISLSILVCHHSISAFTR